ncbi:MAG: hypothetical protein HW421_2152 [Ignavibacteria bacterium]|nr:hypothetical protein [Ignavibacteria bacterium]
MIEKLAKSNLFLLERKILGKVRNCSILTNFTALFNNSQFETIQKQKIDIGK